MDEAFYPPLNNEIQINFFAPNDQISLEYEDHADLKLLPLVPGLVEYADTYGVFLVLNCTVYIIDNDRKLSTCAHTMCFALHSRRKVSFNLEGKCTL